LRGRYAIAVQALCDRAQRIPSRTLPLDAAHDLLWDSAWPSEPHPAQLLDCEGLARSLTDQPPLEASMKKR
jgi:hypothetical protein